MCGLTYKSHLPAVREVAIMFLWVSFFEEISGVASRTRARFRIGAGNSNGENNVRNNLKRMHTFEGSRPEPLQVRQATSG